MPSQEKDVLKHQSIAHLYLSHTHTHTHTHTHKQNKTKESGMLIFLNETPTKLPLIIEMIF
jgi:hypothetical protein